MPIIEVEVDDKTASDLEALETRFFAWKRAKNEAERRKIMENSVDTIAKNNPVAFLLHTLRPPHLFGKGQDFLG